MTKQVTGIKTRIETADFDASLRFYSQVIGLHILEQWRGKDPGAILGASDKRSEGFLEIGYTPVAEAQNYLSLQFRVTDLDDFVERLDGVWEHSDPVARPWGSTYVYLRDPNGLRIIVFDGEI